MKPRLHHLNCGSLSVPSDALTPPVPPAACHCLLLETAVGLILIDAGIGLQDCLHPKERLGQALIDAAGFQFDELQTAVRHIEHLRHRASDVKHIVLTHADPDHTGGLADFPEATVHLSLEELGQISTPKPDPRYVPALFAHGPHCRPYGPVKQKWFGLEARPLPFLKDFFLVPLPGHTAGHSGVAFRHEKKWVLHAGDAYYLRGQLTQEEHPIEAFAAARAVDNDKRLATLVELRRLVKDHSDEITILGYHDPTEFPSAAPAVKAPEVEEMPAVDPDGTPQAAHTM